MAVCADICAWDYDNDWRPGAVGEKMKIKRSPEELAIGFPHMPSRPDLRSFATKRMSRPSKFAKLDAGFKKLEKFYARHGLYIGP